MHYTSIHTHLAVLFCSVTQRMILPTCLFCSTGSCFHVYEHVKYALCLKASLASTSTSSSDLVSYNRIPTVRSKSREPNPTILPCIPFVTFFVMQGFPRV